MLKIGFRNNNFLEIIAGLLNLFLLFFSLFWGLTLFSMIVPAKHKGIDNYILSGNEEQ